MQSGDRHEISEMDSISRGRSSSRNRASDATGSSSGQWSQERTKVMPGATRPQGQSALSRPSQNTLKTRKPPNLHKPSVSVLPMRPGTFQEPERKRQRLSREHHPHPSKASAHSDVIGMTDEDTGVVVPRVKTNPFTSVSAPLGKKRLSDGDHTTALRDKYNKRQSLRQDSPIGSFDSSPPANQVKKIVEAFEMNGQLHGEKRVPIVDFSKSVTSKRQMTMRPKLPLQVFKLPDNISTPSNSRTFQAGSDLAPPVQPEQKDPIATNTSHFFSKGDEHTLPIYAFYFGTKRFPGRDNHTTYFLTWNPQRKGVLSIKLTIPPAKSLFTINLAADEAVESLQISDVNPASDDHPFVVIMRTATPHKAKAYSCVGANTERHFKLGSAGFDGQLAIRFDTDHLVWDNKKFEHFHNWMFKAVVNRTSLRHPKGAWDMCEQGEEQAEALRQRATQPSRPPRKAAAVTKKPPDTELKPLPAPESDNDSLPEIIPFPFLTDHDNAPKPVPKPPSLPHFSDRLPKPISASKLQGEPTRRSTRTATRDPPSLPNPDGDEIILVYPPDAPGAVNITNNDLARLEPGEFLNDTLIEFGLKLWMNNLKEKNPELANSIHVFNSFFYKKLSADKLTGYDSVRKWTSKFDLFGKKYIIVPINENLHWYLAIIYEPEHVLQPPPPPPPKPVPRPLRTTRNRPSVEEAHPMDNEPTPSETQVENEVTDLAHFGSSCSIEQEGENKPESETKPPIDDDEIEYCEVEPVPMEVDLPEKTMTMDVDEPVVQEPAPEPELAPVPEPSSVRVSTNLKRRRSPSTEPETPTAEADDDGKSSTTATEMLRPKEGLTKLEEFRRCGKPKAAPKSNAVPTTMFYGSKPPVSRKGKEKEVEEEAIVIPASDGSDQEEVEVSDVQEDNNAPTTAIFTLDSLGSSHRAAINRLNEYLKMEAKTKKGVENSSDAKGTRAAVPAQPNYCDCGLYLLHFVETFMEDPQKFHDIIRDKKKSRSLTEERNRDWNASIISGLREKLSGTVRELSETWKAEKKLKDEARKKETEGKVEMVEDSDDDIDIVGDFRMPSPKKTGGPRNGKAGQKSSAARLR